MDVGCIKCWWLCCYVVWEIGIVNDGNIVVGYDFFVFNGVFDVVVVFCCKVNNDWVGFYCFDYIFGL